MTVDDLVAGIRADLAAHGDPRRAVHAPADRPQWESAVRELWDGATHREEWYAALALARHRAAVTPTIRAWAGADQPWLRRVSVLSQHRHRAETDVDLLVHAIEANLAESHRLGAARVLRRRSRLGGRLRRGVRRPDERPESP